MRVHFRVDASEALGAGHLVRCLVLADAMVARGGRCRFFLRDINPYAKRILNNTVHEVCSLEIDETEGAPADAEALRRKIQVAADWLVVDHYDLDADWERIARAGVRRILVIDDLANRPHDCDLLVDPGLGRRVEDYAIWIGRSTQMLLGTRYAILKPAYAEFHGAAPVWPTARLAHVFFGGGSPATWLPAYVGAMLDAVPTLSVLAIGLGNEEAMHKLAGVHGARLQWRPHVDDMAAEYARCDVAIGSPGTATWERACIGLPSGLVATARNQVPILRGLERQGFCRYLGATWEFDTPEFVRFVQAWMQDQAALAATRALGVASVDGLGAQRIVQKLFAKGGGDD
jgi:UDP-2,4-diacetamido-2,4,6-trideoxy-beta-L-altropyranose hydrolase